MRINLRRKAVVLASLIGLGIFGAPFGTNELSLSERLVYWGLVMVGVSVIMECLLYLAVTHQEMRRFRYLPLIFATVALAAVPGAIVVTSVEVLVVNEPLTFRGLARIWAAVTFIGFLVALVEYPPSSRRSGRAHADTGKGADYQPGHIFLNRLDPGMGSHLVSLSIRDHYLEVVTKGGRQMLLMSLADAEAELADYRGMRVHRSHWVALDAVNQLHRHGHKWLVETVVGETLPVSRDLGPALKTALEADAMDEPVAGP